MYRPTVRMDDRYKNYVDQLFQETNLDRNQIIRLAMFAAPFSGIFRSKIEQHMKQGLRDCPQPSWSPQQADLWKGQGND